MYQHRRRGRMVIDRRAVAIQAQRNYREVAIERSTMQIALVAILDVPAQEHARGLQVARIGIDDRSEERRVGKSVDLGGRRIIKKKKERKKKVERKEEG